MALLTLEEINKLDIVDYLASLGYSPKKTSGNYCWYHSMLPGRGKDSEPSFRVNRKLNRWKDFGTGEGTTLVDFGILFFNCTIRELVIKLSGPMASIENVSRHDPALHAAEEKKIEVLNAFPIRSGSLIHYLHERRIPLSVARKYCKEVHYTFDGQRTYYGLGFSCDAGGYEIRNKFHKYASRPKSPTLLRGNARDIAVFEGFFDMMTLVTLLQCPDQELPDLLVLNSLGFFEAQMPVIEHYEHKYLFLDYGKGGDRCTRLALDRKCGYRDLRPLYRGYKDLNDWACQVGNTSIPCLIQAPAVLQAG
jgi:hypothetical protein